jgi:hypothetical protein
MEKKTITELGGALQRAAELSTKAIKESGDAGELRALESYITTTLRANAEEFLSAVLVIDNEYRPLVQGLAGALGNALQVINARNRNAQPKAEIAPEPEPSAEVPSNVVPFPKEK